MTKALCAGSFDPITLGHIDVIERAHALFGAVVVAVGTNSTKNYLFDYDERMALTKEAIAHLPRASVEPLSGLLVDFAREHSATMIVKGMRFASDFDFELQQAHMNHAMSGIETILLPASREWVTLSSTIIRQVSKLGGDVSAYVPPNVLAAIEARRAAS